MKAAIPRTATFAWSPASPFASSVGDYTPYLATGTVAGALDESFSNESVLEIWKPGFGGEGVGDVKPLGSIATTARFNRLAWGFPSSARPRGLLAAGLENGEVRVWDAGKIIDAGLTGVGSSAGEPDSVVLENDLHKGPVRGLDFNHVQQNLLASGATEGQWYFWDLNAPSKPYQPDRSAKLADITSLAWNLQVQHILATASNSGYTVVWDLRGRREVVALSYGGGAATAGGGVGVNGSSALAAGGRRGMSAIAWHPDTATRLITASEDDSSPILMVWDLRNSRAPEKILTGHEKGILSLAWCQQDADLLLSCGKDNRTICWNPQTTEIIGELPPSGNWSFQVEWCPRNPDMLATASFDGKIGVHSLQMTRDDDQQAQAVQAASADGADIFDSIQQTQPTQHTLSLRQPPKWLRRPISASFGFGGKLVSTSNLPGASGKTQSAAVHLRTVVTEPNIVDRATKLLQAVEDKSLATFCEERSKDACTKPDEVASWKALQTLFQADSRDELVALLGFSKEDVATQVASAIKTFKLTGATSPSAVKGTLSEAAGGSDGSVNFTHEPSVTFAETPSSEDGTTEASASASASAAGAEATPSEASEANKLAEAESETTEPSLFGDDTTTATPADGADFFNSLVAGEGPSGVRSALPERVLVPHSAAAPGSSVAATAGSPGPSSVASESLKPTTFHIYPSDESDADKLITRALVLGDFESAVSLCISTDRFADALLLAVRGGPELLQSTQKAYFERRTTSLPYLRLFQSIVGNDLTDVVQNADLNEWQEIFVVLCTFAKPEEFAGLAEQLGQRLEFQYAAAAAGAGHGDAQRAAKGKEYRKNAVLCYLAAGKLEKVVGIWIAEMKEEEAAMAVGAKPESIDAKDSSLYTVHAEALQTFMEKVTVFQSAVNYVDTDVSQPTQDDTVAEAGARTYKLAALYDRIHEYADLLADQGLVQPALQYMAQTPVDYNGAKGDATESKSGLTRDRLLRVTGQRSDVFATGTMAKAPSATPVAPAVASMSGYSSSNQYAPSTANRSAVPAVPAAPMQPTSVYDTTDPYSAQTSTHQAYGSAAPMSYGQTGSSWDTPSTGAYDPYAPSHSPYGQQQPPQPAQSIVPPPPRPLSSTGFASQAPPPPPSRRDTSGWNDAPMIQPKRSATPAQPKVAPITSPFPNSPAPMQYGQAGQGGALPPPPRSGTPGLSFGGASPPPPQGGHYRPGSVGPQGPPPGPPRGGQHAPQQPPPPPPPHGAGMSSRPGQQRGLPNAYGPPPVQQGHPAGAGGPYAAPPGRASPAATGPYAPQQQGMRGPPRPGPGGQFAAAPGPVGGPGGQPPQGPPGPPGPPQQMGGAAPPPAAPPLHQPAGHGPPPRAVTPAAKPAAQSKYPPGDRSHMPESSKPIFGILSREVQRLKATSPPQAKRQADDVERRLNMLFDGLNCDTVPKNTLDLLVQLAQAVERRDVQGALSVHLQLITGGPSELTQVWPGVKMLVTRMGS